MALFSKKLSHTLAELAEYAKDCGPNGSLVLNEVIAIGTIPNDELNKLSPAVRLLPTSTFDRSYSLLVESGFVDIRFGEVLLPLETVADELAGAGLTREDIRAIGPRMAVVHFEARTPPFAIGTSFPLKLKPKAKAAEEVASAWGVAPDALAGAPSVDERTIVAEADLRAAGQASSSAAAMDCGTGSAGKRKACKDCSCGLASQLAAQEAGLGPVVKLDAADVPASACGSCALGDAFRCAGCPSKGLPAGQTYKPGQVVKVNLEDDVI